MSVRNNHLLPVFTLWLAFTLAAGFSGGCTEIYTLPGTRIPATKENKAIVDRVEEYRIAMEQRDSAKILSMTSPTYYEDSGTLNGSDDYGYAGLRQVLNTRLPAIRSMRYAIQYRGVAQSGNRATVDIRYDISYQIVTEIGDRWERKQSDKRLELLNDNGRWLFLAGL